MNGFHPATGWTPVRDRTDSIPATNGLHSAKEWSPFHVIMGTIPRQTESIRKRMDSILSESAYFAELDRDREAVGPRGWVGTQDHCGFQGSNGSVPPLWITPSCLKRRKTMAAKGSASSAKFSRWGVAVSNLQQELAQMPHIASDLEEMERLLAQARELEGRG